jgi:hypothetical protein
LKRASSPSAIGKSANLDLPHRFGPLTQDVGYRRLTEAVTRAKRRMCVISSFSHDEIDLDRFWSRGVPVRESIEQYSDRELRKIGEWVASDGLLRTGEELMRSSTPYRSSGWEAGSGSSAGTRHPDPS